MKVQIINHRGEDTTLEASSGIKVFDGQGNIFILRTNKFGELEINGSDGSLSIEPKYSNEIVIKQNT